MSEYTSESITADTDYIVRPGFERGFQRRTRQVGVKQALGPLFERLRAYDSLRIKLEEHGASFFDLAHMTQLMKTPFVIRSGEKDYSAKLTEPQGLRSAIHGAGGYGLKLEVRQGDNRLPLYYLCRIVRDYWYDFTLIAEDLYKSPGYPESDERFMKIMDFGHEVWRLRVSLLRSEAEKVLKDVFRLRGLPCTAGDVDRFLFRAGKYVLQAAWHEDQRLAVMTASAFGLGQFRNAVELLYLCLSSDACELRSVVDKALIRFFDDVYPQAAIARFLKALPDFDGARLNRLHEEAIDLYRRLAAAFSAFLRIEVNWSSRKMKVPLFKVLYANYSRFKYVVPSLRAEASVIVASRELEKESAAITAGLTGIDPEEDQVESVVAGADSVV
jgi:hypothetical protein